jgi:hypothetical protein
MPFNFFEISPVFRKHYPCEAAKLDKIINLVNNTMSSDEETIIDALKTGKFLISVHAARRMIQRSITEADMRACGQTARSCLHQPQHGTWRIEGEDLEGEILTVICGFDDGVVIVTIF